MANKFGQSIRGWNLQSIEKVLVRSLKVFIESSHLLSTNKIYFVADFGTVHDREDRWQVFFRHANSTHFVFTHRGLESVKCWRLKEIGKSISTVAKISFTKNVNKLTQAKYLQLNKIYSSVCVFAGSKYFHSLKLRSESGKNRKHFFNKMSDASQDLPPEEDDAEMEFILSLCWDSGILSAVYYNLTTLELHVSFHRPEKL